MTGLWRRMHDNDEGSIILALLGILILTSVVAVGLATVVNGQYQTRHDNTFAQALTGAETGLDAMVAQIKANPTASSFTTITGTNTTTGAGYTTSASLSNGVWVVDSKGTATTQKNTITREVKENVTVSGIYSVPLFGNTQLKMGSGSGVNEYDSGTNGSSPNTACGTLPNTGLLGSGLVATTMCTPTIASTGPAATDGALTMSSGDLNSFSAVNVDNAAISGYPDPERTGTCVGDATSCASSKVVTSTDSLNYPDSTQCSNGIGATASAITGSNYLAAGAVYNVAGNLTLNTAVTANITNLASSGITLCFNSSLTVPSLGAAGVTVPWNSYVVSAVPLQYAPRPPATLTLIDTNTTMGSSTIYLGDGLNPETAISAVIYAPKANCVVSGHLDLYGVLVCGSISAPSGVSVHYDKELSSTFSEASVTVSNWREVH
jgi:hypothetical protein